ncbi:MAG: prepilin-type N-terminal cleavage/methylation domain-containing protein [Solirubrobacteraceae bacterium]|nr:prepilin-type N-terminal cleavage/methylation domain-containing protein [Solirubrobacteraceae bacterium]
MKDRIKRLKVGGGQDGFTLIELLVVITILGILAAIVVFSVGGINDRGHDSACESDVSTLRIAQEAHFAQEGSYANEDALVAENFLAKASVYHDTTGGATTYNITRVETPVPPGGPCPVP